MCKTRILSLLLLCAILLTGFAYAAEPERLFSEGFEHWQVSVSHDSGVTNYNMTCPKANVSMDELQAYTLHIMRYCREKNPPPSSVTIWFPYEGVGFSGISSEVLDAISMGSGIRAVGSSFLNLSACKLQQDAAGIGAVVLTLDVNNPHSASNYAKDIPFGASLDAIRALADEIQDKTSDPQEQLRLLNEYLIENVEYGSADEAGRAHSPVGALLDGKAMCAGYAATVQDVCYLLNIPAYQLHDRKNAHIWNVVLLGGQWLMLDTTFNDTGNADTRFFLLPDFADEHHFYTAEGRAKLAGYTMTLHAERFAAQRLSEQGILHGDGDGGFALGRALTYEELAVILARLDRAEHQIQLHRTMYCALAADSGAQAWAAPYVGYCMERGYFDHSLNLTADNRVTNDVATQIMAQHDTTTTSPNISLTMGRYLRRGTFFQMMQE
jgi:Transglutaminase-like superfamily.